MASQITSYLPPYDGVLPYWLFLLSIVSIGNSIQSYTTLYYTQRVYCGSDAKSDPSRPTPSSPATPLSARTFGTWTFLASLVRLYAAYNISNPAIYQLALWTYGLAFAHFMSEWWIFGSTRWGKPLAGPIIVSAVSLPWMLLQWGHYIKA